jgi:hypothetical protein
MNATKEMLKHDIDGLEEVELERLYPLIKQLIQDCKQQPYRSLFDELQDIKIEAPQDFALNFDQYLTGEKNV